VLVKKLSGNKLYKVMKARTMLKIVLVVVVSLIAHLSWAQSCNCKYTVGLTETNVDGKALSIQPGDVICIQAGNRGVLRFSNVVGTAAKPVIIKNCGGLVNIENTDKSYAVWFSASRYFKVTGTGDASINYGIRAKTSKSGSNAFVVSDLSSDVEVDHIEVAGAGFAGIMAKTDPRCDLTANRGVFTMYNVNIHENYVHDVTGEGMYIGNSFYNGWTGNTSCSGTTLYPHDIIGCKVYKNIIKRTGCEAIQVGTATGCEIYNNDIELFGQDPFANYQNNGVQIGLGTGGKMYNNVIKNGPGNGIIVQGKGDNVIYNNIIIGAGSNGIYCDDATTSGTLGSGFSFINNTIITPGGDGLKIAAERVAMNHFINNIIIKPGTGVYVNKTPTSVKMEEVNNYYSANIADAKFANAASNDFHLLSTSPALNKGASTSTYGVTFDYDSKARPAGGVYDIGAFELQAAGNSIPTVNAGADKTITLPTATVSLTGTAADADGSIASYTWTKQSGGAATLGGATTATLSASALVAGTYTFRLTVKDNAGASAYDDVVVTVSSTSKPPVATATPIFRINTGGAAISASPINWITDTQAAKAQYLDAASANYTAGGSSWSGTNTTGAPNNLFGPNRYSPNYGGTTMEWNFPVQSGTYQVNLYFAETPYTGGVKTAGARVFHVNAEGTRKVSNIDIYAEAGMNALKKQFEVTVTDGTLDLDFVRSVGNPQVNGIEIVALTTQTTTTARTASEEEFETTEETTEETSAVASVQASPNPFTDRLNLTLTSTSENVSIVLQDMNGFTVLEDMQQDVSEINLDFGTTRLPAGIYILTVNADGKVAKQRVIKR
jgi:hypothetical protein